jgi:hypothetical protein
MTQVIEQKCGERDFGGTRFWSTPMVVDATQVVQAINGGTSSKREVTSRD